MKECIGFVGLGQMGQPMVFNLLQAGFELRVFDLHEERLIPLLAQGGVPGAAAWGCDRVGRYRAQYGTVLGRPEVAEAAQLSIFLSGHSDAKGRVLPLLEALGRHIYDLGERVEVANVVKLGYNFLIAAAIEAMGEAAALVEQCGADRA